MHPLISGLSEYPASSIAALLSYFYGQGSCSLYPFLPRLFLKALPMQRLLAFIISRMKCWENILCQSGGLALDVFISLAFLSMIPLFGLKNVLTNQRPDYHSLLRPILA